MWILGNEETLSKSDSYWEQLVLDAKVRQCFFNADDDKDLQTVILEVKKELHQLGDMLKADSMFFRNAKWKVCDIKNLQYYISITYKTWMSLTIYII